MVGIIIFYPDTLSKMNYKLYFVCYTFANNVCHLIIVAVECYVTASVNTLWNNGLECANGNTVSKWNGCIDQGSVRVRCPKDHLPCNDLAGNGIEFGCWHDCTGHGGVRVCLVEGIFVNEPILP